MKNKMNERASERADSAPSAANANELSIITIDVEPEPCDCGHYSTLRSRNPSYLYSKTICLNLARRRTERAGPATDAFCLVLTVIQQELMS